MGPVSVDNFTPEELRLLGEIRNGFSALRILIDDIYEGRLSANELRIAQQDFPILLKQLWELCA